MGGLKLVARVLIDISERGWQEEPSLKKKYEHGTQEEKKNLNIVRSTSLSLPNTQITVIVNVMCQLNWATISRYLVRYYSGCFSKGDFWSRVTFK